MVVFRNERMKIWYIMDLENYFDEKMEYKKCVYFADFGKITLSIFNILNRIRNGKVLKTVNDEIYRSFITFTIANKEYWISDFEKMEKSMLNKSQKSKEERFSDFRKYADLPERIFRKEYAKDFWAEKRNTINWNKSCENLGFYYSPYLDDVFDVYVCRDISSLFILDFKEYLFNNNMDETEIVKCPHCNDYFIRPTKKQIYCNDCRNNPKEKNKIDYERRRDDDIAKEIVRIQNMLGRRAHGNKNDEILDNFNTQQNYYKKKINKNYNMAEWEIMPKYENVKMETEEDLLIWLKSEHELLKKNHSRK